MPNGNDKWSQYEDKPQGKDKWDQYTEATPATGVATKISPRTTGERAKEFGLDVAGWLPAVGGAVGGILGGVPGAAAGGVAGKSAQRLAETAMYGKEPTGETPSEAVGELAKSGAEQAAYEVGGKVLGKGLQKLGGPEGERWAARPVSKMLRQSLPETATDVSYPGLILAREPDIPVLTGKYGMKNAIKARVASLTDQLDGMAAAQSQQGRTVNLQTAVGDTIQKLQRVPQEYEMDSFVNSLSNLEKRITSKQVPGAFVDVEGAAVPMRQSRGLANMTVEDAIEYRRDLGEMIDNTSGPAQKALRKVYTAVTKQIHDASPEVAGLDNRIHNLIYAREAMEGRVSHLETGVMERGAGSGAEEKLLEKLRIPGVRSVPVSRVRSKLYGGAHKVAKAAAGGPIRQGVIKQVPRAIRGSERLPPPPGYDDDNE